MFLSLRSDGRQSAVVTKLFIVDQAPSELPEPSEDNEEHTVETLEQNHVEHVSHTPALPRIYFSICTFVVHYEKWMYEGRKKGYRAFLKTFFLTRFISKQMTAHFLQSPSSATDYKLGCYTLRHGRFLLLPPPLFITEIKKVRKLFELPSYLTWCCSGFTTGAGEQCCRCFYKRYRRYTLALLVRKS